jgi:hypothetical protein
MAQDGPGNFDLRWFWIQPKRGIAAAYETVVPGAVDVSTEENYDPLS